LWHILHRRLVGQTLSSLGDAMTQRRIIASSHRLGYLRLPDEVRDVCKRRLRLRAGLLKAAAGHAPTTSAVRRHARS
jgi:hypothetical protein